METISCRQSVGYHINGSLVSRNKVEELNTIIEHLADWEVVDGVYVDREGREIKCGTMNIGPLDIRGRERRRGCATQVFNPLSRAAHLEIVEEYLAGRAIITTTRHSGTMYSTYIIFPDGRMSHYCSMKMTESRLFALLGALDETFDPLYWQDLVGYLR